MHSVGQGQATLRLFLPATIIFLLVVTLLKDGKKIIIPINSVVFFYWQDYLSYLQVPTPKDSSSNSFQTAAINKGQCQLFRNYAHHVILVFSLSTDNTHTLQSV